MDDDDYLNVGDYEDAVVGEDGCNVLVVNVQHCDEVK